MTVHTLNPEFVTTVPNDLEEGVLYISIPFRTSIHLCACGCSNKVVMPIRPGAWQLTYDGETISMAPSVGNWSFPCRSHYWIRHSAISWAATWDDERASCAKRPSNTGHAPLPKPDNELVTAALFRKRARAWFRRLLGHCHTRD